MKLDVKVVDESLKLMFKDVVERIGGLSFLGLIGAIILLLSLSHLSLLIGLVMCLFTFGLKMYDMKK